MFEEVHFLLADLFHFQNRRNVFCMSGSLPPSRLTKRPLPPCEAEACRHGTTGMKNFLAKTDASGIEKNKVKP